MTKVTLRDRIADFLGKKNITPAIAWTIASMLLSGLTGPLVALLISQQFSPAMQGYYYTFSSLLALSIFLELGFNGCIVQFISHEYANMSMDKGRLHSPSSLVLGRLASLARLSLKWYSVAGVLLFFGVGVGGHLFFSHNQTAELIDWQRPWWCLCACSAVNLVLLPFWAVLEGCNQVDWTSKARVYLNFGRSFTLLTGLLFGFGLYAPAIATLCGIIVSFIQFSSKWRSLFEQLMSCPVEEKISWTREILPMQWRIAVSWASGYFIFSIFSPLLFAFGGAKAAGQFGMTWSVIMAISNLSQSFVTTRGPKFGALIAKSDWITLRNLWRVALIQSTALCSFGSIALILGVIVIKEINYPLGDRLIPLSAIVPLCIAGILNQVVFTIATVARAEKREPFLWPSVAVALIVAGTSYLSVQLFSVDGLAFSYLGGTLVGFCCALIILKGTRMQVGYRRLQTP